nr:PREDICTED: uncharacterized protein LOC107075721 isoform X2 [Lepisosteus oculatus]
MVRREDCLLLLWIAFAHPAQGEVFYVRENSRSLDLPCSSSHLKSTSWKYSSNGNDYRLIFTIDKSGSQRKGHQFPAQGRAKPGGRGLQISPVKKNDSGWYMCEQDQKQLVTHRLLIIEVFTKPEGPFLQNTNVTMHCQVGGRTSEKLKWLSPNGAEEGEGTVEISKISPAHTGNWKCEITDVKKYVETLNIDVLGMNPQPLSKQTAKQGDNVFLPCLLSSPLSYTFRSLNFIRGGWMKDDKPLLDLYVQIGTHMSWNATMFKEIEYPKVNDLKTNLSISLIKVKPQQSGIYNCYLRFKEGTITSTIVLKVEGAPGGTGDTSHSNTGSAESVSVFGLNMNLWVLVSIAIGSVVLIILIIVAIILLLRKKRLKKRMRKRRSQRQPLTARDYCQCNRNNVSRNVGRQRENGNSLKQQLH